MLQDILILESSKIFIIFVFAVLSAKPQLQVIKRVINDRALSLVQDGAKARAGARDGYGTRGRSEMSVVQVRYSAVSVVKLPTPKSSLVSLVLCALSLISHRCPVLLYELVPHSHLTSTHLTSSDLTSTPRRPCLSSSTFLQHAAQHTWAV
jgi:hypothetical protein